MTADARSLDRYTATPSEVKLLLVITCVAVAVCVFAFAGGLLNLVTRWSVQEEYSHGFLIPAISLWLMWRRRQALQASLGRPSKFGIAILILSIAMLLLGELSAIFLIVQLGFLVALVAITLLIGGFGLLRVCLFPILFLGFAIPLPYMIDSVISWRLQLLSSELGVYFIRLFNVPVHLEGNIIDLGAYQLQVVEACSGLRYLYPLLSLSALAAYFFSAPLWLRVLVVASAVPITIVMNSFRIGVIGLLVDLWGTEMAEGALHFFEGWVIFMACAALLALEVWLIARLFLRKAFWDVVGPPEIHSSKKSVGRFEQHGKTLVLGSIFAMAAAGALVLTVSSRAEAPLDRTRFVQFPKTIGEWTSQVSFLEPRIEHTLGLDDYILADYRLPQSHAVNLYIAYYSSQRKGYSPHSPRVCIPGGGWLITEFSRPEFVDQATGLQFPINRAIIERGSSKLLVYYWFDQRGRRIANEYWNKWYIFADALTKNRTDGSLVRLTTVVTNNESVAEADRRLQHFIKDLAPNLGQFLPS